VQASPDCFSSGGAPVGHPGFGWISGGCRHCRRDENAARLTLKSPTGLSLGSPSLRVAFCASPSIAAIPTAIDEWSEGGLEPVERATRAPNAQLWLQTHPLPVATAEVGPAAAASDIR